jgi:pimeloyl-ACP methyl ester carboxylesterase
MVCLLALPWQELKNVFGDDTKIEKVGVESFYSYLNTEGVLGHTKRLANSVEYPDTTRISQIKQPTLIIWGDLDKIIPVEHAYKFNRDIPNNHLIIYKGSGHIPMIENYKETLRDVLNFFNQNHIAL